MDSWKLKKEIDDALGRIRTELSWIVTVMLTTASVIQVTNAAKGKFRLRSRDAPFMQSLLLQILFAMPGQIYSGADRTAHGELHMAVPAS